MTHKPTPSMEQPTLRDSMAMTALTGLLSKAEVDVVISRPTIENIVRISYEISDLMLAAREKK